MPLRPPRRKWTPIKIRITNKSGATAKKVILRAKGKGVAFKKRTVVGWRGMVLVRCGGYPDPVITQWATYDFPKAAKIKKGRTDARRRGDGFTVQLRATFDGRKVRDGYFSYSGPNRCFGTVNVNARRAAK